MTSIACRDVIGGSWGWMLVSGHHSRLARYCCLGVGFLVGINLITPRCARVMAALPLTLLATVLCYLVAVKAVKGLFCRFFFGSLRSFRPSANWTDNEGCDNTTLRVP